MMTSHTIRNVKAGDMLNYTCQIQYIFTSRGYSGRNDYANNTLTWNKCSVTETVACEYRQLQIRCFNALNKTTKDIELCSTLSRHTFFFYSHSYSSTKSVLFQNHQSLFSVRCTLSLEWTSHGTTLASLHTVFPTFTFCCTWQFITTTFSTITTICHYFSLLFRT